MKKILLLFLANVLLISNSYNANGQTYNITPVLQNGSPETTYNLVILAEAFKQNQLSDFVTKANLVDDIMNLNPVYKSLLKHINIYAISTPSIDGEISLIANNPSSWDPIQTTISKSTFFNIYFQNSYRAYFLDDITINKARRVAAEHVPFVDDVLILVNASQGQPISGRATSSQDLAVIGVDNNFSTDWEKYVLIHELGHSLGGLSDEYSASLDEGFNVTTNNNPETIRWKELLSNPKVGIESINPGIYIPNSSCLMNSVNHTFFCQVCSNRLSNVIQTNKLLKIPEVHRMSLLSEDLNNNIFSFGWDPIAGATNYEVIYLNYNFDTNTATTYSHTTTNNTVTFDLPGSSIANYAHNVKIRAYNANYSTHFFSYKVPYQQYIPVVFQVPSNIKVTNRTSTSFRLQWDSETDSHASLIRMWNDQGVFSEILTDLKDVTINNLDAGKNYKIQIAAVAPYDVALNNSSPFSEKQDINTLSTNEFEKQKIVFFPNPTSHTIQINNLMNSVDYKIYNLNNQEIKRGNLSSETNKIDVKDISKGFYFIQLNNNQSFKFLKE